MDYKSDMSNSVDINVGAKCTASCKHCCFSCTPDSLECLSDKESVRQVL